MTPHDDSPSAGDDALHRYLAARGLPAEAVRRGLRGLVSAWENVARGAARYDLTLDDWRNDLDLRDIIAGAVAVAPERDRHATHDALNRADALFRKGTVDTGRPLWGMSDQPADHAEGSLAWWYRRRPARPGETMRADLDAEGFPTDA